MRYPVVLAPEPEGGFTVTFPDIPEAITHGENEESALRHGADALESALDFYFETKRPIPLPSRLKKGQRIVELPPSVAATVLLYNEMLAQKVRPAELAKRLKIPPQNVNRLLDRRHATKIDNTASALKALGKRIEISLV